jgi:transcriptional regulator with XRE-family HTH domain
MKRKVFGDSGSKMEGDGLRQSPIMLRMREARILCGLSIGKAAAMVDLSAQAVKDGELGRFAPYPAMRKKLSKLYGVPEEILFADWDEISAFIREVGVAGTRSKRRTGRLVDVLPKYRGKKFDSRAEVHKTLEPEDD